MKVKEEMVKIEYEEMIKVQQMFAAKSSSVVPLMGSQVDSMFSKCSKTIFCWMSIFKVDEIENLFEDGINKNKSQ